MASYYLNTYAPLVSNVLGRTNSETHRVPPFTDGSIRREPDLAHKSPGISCLCRGDKFAPRLQLGDVVGYMTRKGTYGCGFAHWRLTSVLKVRKIVASHEEAAAWYRKWKMRLPSNCMVDGNPPAPLTKSHRLHKQSHLPDEELALKWDRGYRGRSLLYPTFVICRSLFRDLSWNAPVVRKEDLEYAFGKVPGTQTPGRLPEKGFRKLMKRLKVEVRLGPE